MSRLRGRLRLTFRLGMASLGAAAAAQILNYYREPLFGVVPGNAAHNFGFNLTYYLPLMLLSAALALVAAVLYFLGIRALLRGDSRPRAGEWLSVLPAVPALLITAVTGCFVVWVLLSS